MASRNNNNEPPTDEQIKQQALEIEKFKLKKLIKALDSAQGNGTSMITLQLTPKDQIAMMTKMLNQEYGMADNIKSHVNKLSVQTGIRSTLEKLKLYNRTPPNGLVILCGTVSTDGNKEKKVSIDFEPFKAVSRTLYWCDSRFDTSELKTMLESDDKFGFIIMDGSGTLVGTVCGNTREVLHRVSVELPKKHGRGGQSALRFARLRLERRHNYLRKVAELATQFFISNDRPNVKGLVLAGSADFKNDLNQSDLFDPRLRPVVLKIVDVAYGGENGFNQAIELSADALTGVRLVQEKKLINKYFDDIAKDTNMYCFGVEDTKKALEMGAVQILLIWEELEFIRHHTVHPSSGLEEEHWLKPTQIEDPKWYKGEDGAVLEVTQTPIVDWIAENYRKYGCQLEFITNKSSEGSQFVRGFGGIGAFLRYAVNFMVLNEQEEEAEGYAAAAADDWDDDEFM